jgi:hypothetical protein
MSSKLARLKFKLTNPFGDYEKGQVFQKAKAQLGVKPGMIWVVPLKYNTMPTNTSVMIEKWRLEKIN